MLVSQSLESVETYGQPPLELRGGYPVREASKPSTLTVMSVRVLLLTHRYLCGRVLVNWDTAAHRLVGVLPRLKFSLGPAGTDSCRFAPCCLPAAPRSARGVGLLVITWKLHCWVANSWQATEPAPPKSPPASIRTMA